MGTDEPTNQHPPQIPAPTVERTPPAAPMVMTKVTEMQTTPMGSVTTTVEPPTRSGWHTTEFWQAMLSQVVGLGLLVYGVVTGNDQATMYGTILAGVTTSAYALARGMSKKV